MKSTGIVRKLDPVGRVVLPIELRKTLKLDNDASLEIFVEQDKIILRKYVPCCIFCGKEDGLTEYMNNNVCSDCAKAINEA